MRIVIYPGTFDPNEKFVSDAIDHLNKDGILILESSIKEYTISPDRIKEYGDTQLTFWRNK